jgi:uncharacterized protein (DUF952 family)
MNKVFKIVRDWEWKEAQNTGVFEGSVDDIRDGFLHFSACDQLRETAAKHFVGETDLLLVTVDADALPFRWDVSRGGAKFPHLYEALKHEDVLDVVKLSRGADGTLFFSDDIP